MSIEEVKAKVNIEAKKAGGQITLIADYINNELLTCQDNADKIQKKTLDEVMAYIKREAQKVAKNGMAMIQDNEVYGWIREFYEISDLTVVKEKPVSIFDFL